MDTNGTRNNEWAEALPPNCPPKEADRPRDEEYFRLVRTIPPQEEDFFSQRRLFPDKQFKNVSECMARSCSILSSIPACTHIMKLPLHRGKKVVRISLPPQSGVLQQTSSNPHHFSWWRRKDFDPIPSCEEVVEFVDK